MKATVSLKRLFQYQRDAFLTKRKKIEPFNPVIIPAEIWKNIFIFICDITIINKCTGVCKFWKQVIQNIYMDEIFIDLKNKDVCSWPITSVKGFYYSDIDILPLTLWQDVKDTLSTFLCMAFKPKSPIAYLLIRRYDWPCGNCDPKSSCRCSKSGKIQFFGRPLSQEEAINAITNGTATTVCGEYYCVRLRPPGDAYNWSASLL